MALAPLEPLQVEPLIWQMAWMALTEKVESVAWVALNMQLNRVEQVGSIVQSQSRLRSRVAGCSLYVHTNQSHRLLPRFLAPNATQLHVPTQTTPVATDTHSI